MKLTLSRVLVAAALALFASGAMAQTQSVQINAAVLKSCAVTGYTNLISVASYDPNAAAPATADGSISIQCTRGTQYTWIVNDGLNDNGTTRRLASALGPTEYLNYNFLTSIDGFASSVAAPLGMAAPVVGDRSTGRTATMTFGMRVELPINQDVGTDLGLYSDTVDVTIAVAP